MPESRQVRMIPRFRPGDWVELVEDWRVDVQGSAPEIMKPAGAHGFVVNVIPVALQIGMHKLYPIGVCIDGMFGWLPIDKLQFVTMRGVWSESALRHGDVVRLRSEIHAVDEVSSKHVAIKGGSFGYVFRVPEIDVKLRILHGYEQDPLIGVVFEKFAVYAYMSNLEAFG